MGMVVQHNLSAINANNKLNSNVSGLKKSTEKLSSGYAINRAGDNAAGLAISEKMRSQIRGLSQATKNAQDGISLIQTAEGGLNETHSILQRMRELAVQSANGTYQDETDREAIQLEVDALKTEVDRISSSTEYNGIKLLDGSLSDAGSTGSAGPKFGVVDATLNGAFVSSSVAGVKVATTQLATTKVGTETAVWDAAGTTLTLNLAQNSAYTQDQIDGLIKNAKQEDSTATGTVSEVEVNLNNGLFTTGTAATAGTATAAGAKATGTGTAIATAFVGANNLTLTSNKYGADMNHKITINFTAEAGKEKMTTTKAPVYDSVNAIGNTGEYTLALQAGKEYTADDIESILKDNGLDIAVKLTSPNPDSPLTMMATTSGATLGTVTLAGGAGLGDTDALFGQKNYDAIGAGSGGLTFQIGANGTEDQRVTLSVEDMSSKGLGLANIDVSKRASANAAIDTVDSAVKSVSMQRAGLGALQNRLEYTVNNLTTTNENLTAAESQIRDTDMATEMISYTKFNILQQASQAMLAQANQQPQAVLQLLG